MRGAINGEASAPGDAVPALMHIVRRPDGAYRLTGMRCGACACVIEGERLACPRCGERHALERVELATGGRVHAHTVIHRTFPGVPTPFIAAVIDLDDGCTVRGSLTDIDPLIELPPDLRVEMVFRDSGQRDPAGRPLLCYVFVPEKGSPA